MHFVEIYSFATLIFGINLIHSLNYHKTQGQAPTLGPEKLSLGQVPKGPLAQSAVVFLGKKIKNNYKCLTFCFCLNHGILSKKLNTQEEFLREYSSRP
jgi:hypothetical protein